MFKTTTRKQTPTTFKPCLEPLESREQPSSLSMISALGAEVSAVGNQIQAAVQGIPQAAQAFVQDIEQKTDNILTSLNDPSTRAGVDGVLAATGAAMIKFGPLLPPPEDILVPLAGIALDVAAVSDFIHQVPQIGTQ